MHKRLRTALALGAASLLVVTACGGDDDEAAADSGGDSTISIVGFAVPEAANQAIADEWTETSDGEGVEFRTTSYGASGDQSRAVGRGLEADYVHFSVASDVTRLVDAEPRRRHLGRRPDQGHRVLVDRRVRRPGGQPRGHRDLGRPDPAGRRDRHPQPRLVGCGPLEHPRRVGPGHRERRHRGRRRRRTSTAFFDNVVALPSSGRDATTAFLGGTGDVLMSYENEAILAHQNGEEFDYVIPETTMLIENPGAVLIDADPKAQDWLDFVLSEDGQRQFALKGFRPVIDGVEFDEVEGANDPSDPFPEVDQPADGRRATSAAGASCPTSSSTRRRASSR